MFNVVIGENNQALLANMEKDEWPEYTKHEYMRYQLVLDHIREGSV